MYMHNIEFSNRAKRKEGCDPDKINAEFALFSSLCASINVAKYVRNVDYTSNCCCYFIDVDEVYEHTEIGGGIEWAADCTLSQFQIFGRVEHKGGLENDI